MQRILERCIATMQSDLTHQSRVASHTSAPAFSHLFAMRTPITLLTLARTLACNFVSRVYTPTSD